MSDTHKKRPGRFTKGNRGRKFTDEHRRRISDSAKRLRENPEYRDRIVRATLAACRKTPNKAEQKLARFLDNRFPGDWKFVGDGSFILNGYNPDFINVNGKKLIIEMWGDYWHHGEDPADRAKVFEPYGFRTLVIWEHELKNLLAVGSKLKGFINVV
jgi:very-short-patch-repair endonuclease